MHSMHSVIQISLEKDQIDHDHYHDDGMYLIKL